MMNGKIKDKDVLQLLTTLKSSQNNYPQDMIESRRDSFTKQAAAMAILVKAGVNGTNATGTGLAEATESTTSSGAATASAGASIGTILETVLVIAIVIETGVAAYAYREKIAEFINSTFGPKVEQVANPLENPSSNFIASDEITADIPEETPNGTPTITVTPLPPGYTPPVQADNNNNNGSSDSGNTQVASTPDPNDKPGNRYGNTPKPEITKKSNEEDKSPKK